MKKIMTIFLLLVCGVTGLTRASAQEESPAAGIVDMPSILEEAPVAPAEETGTGVDEAAVTAAETWLSLVDAGNYAESWEEASEYFKGFVHKIDWESLLTATRTPLGEMRSRFVDSASFTSAMPGAPDGEYTILQFSSNFAKKAIALETVTMMKEEDGTWRVAGYFIK
jgi:hypothetical protein